MSPLPFSLRRLDDDVAYVTGASAGIGRATAMHLAALGARVYLGARRDERLQEVQREIEAAVPGAVVHTGPLDVTDRASQDRWLARGASVAGTCTILVDNAGLALGRDPVLCLDERDQDAMFDTNVRGAIDLIRKVLPAMKTAGRGDIALVTSIAGVEPYAGGGVYCATKAALLAFARALRAELLESDIRVLTFDPGLVQTEFSVVRHRGDASAAEKPYEGLTPLSARDVADCIAFALTRPRHVSLDRMFILAQAQLGTQRFARTTS